MSQGAAWGGELRQTHKQIVDQQQRQQQDEASKAIADQRSRLAGFCSGIAQHYEEDTLSDAKKPAGSSRGFVRYELDLLPDFSKLWSYDREDGLSSSAAQQRSVLKALDLDGVPQCAALARDVKAQKMRLSQWISDTESESFTRHPGSLVIDVNWE